MRPRPGVLVGDRYELTEPIATGGMGAVWEATDTTLHRPVAIKLLKPELSSDPTFIARFRAEARHSGGLSHPNIAAVYDYGEVADPETGVVSAYLVMELVPGEPLSTVLNSHGSLTPERVMSIMRQVGSGLAAAHAAGIVHRDVKPGNLLLTPDGRVKITDFGIARAVDSVPLTATGTVMGTARYLSPEQATGETVVPASDIYSLGVVAYEALAGRPPFDAQGQVAQAMAHVHEEPRPLPDSVPAPLRALIARMLAKYPDERPPNGASLVQAVDAAARGDDAAATTVISPARDVEATQEMPAYLEEATAATAVAPPVRRASTAPTAAPTTAPPPAGRPKRRLTGPLIALILLVLVVAVGALYADVFGNRDRPVTPATTVTITESASPTRTTPTRTTSTPTTTTTTETETPTTTTTTTPPPSPEPTTPDVSPTTATSDSVPGESTGTDTGAGQSISSASSATEGSA